MIDIIGTIMMLLWVAYVTIGLGSQIYKNKRDNTFGWSMPLFILAFVTYVFGVVYGFLIKDMYILIPYALGFVLLTCMLVQLYFIRKK